jgi:hypothetical protein
MKDILNILKEAWAALSSPYVKWCWLCVAGYFACWLFALFISRLAGNRDTIVYRCRQSLAIAVLLHCLTMLIVTVLWWREYFPFRGFYWYLTPYLALILADLAMIMKLLVGLGGYRNFGR